MRYYTIVLRWPEAAGGHGRGAFTVRVASRREAERTAEVMCQAIDATKPTFPVCTVIEAIEATEPAA